MQKLMAKMKEIKLRVTGKMAVEGGVGAEGSAVTPPSSVTPTPLPADTPPTLAAAGGTGVQPGGEESAAGDLTSEARERQAKIAQNEVLLNKLIQQQNSTMAPQEKAQVGECLVLSTYLPVLVPVCARAWISARLSTYYPVSYYTYSFACLFVSTDLCFCGL